MRQSFQPQGDEERVKEALQVLLGWGWGGGGRAWGKWGVGGVGGFVGGWGVVGLGWGREGSGRLSGQLQKDIFASYAS